MQNCRRDPEVNYFVIFAVGSPVLVTSRRKSEYNGILKR